MNERYQKNTSPSGKTRRSAAAAKPKRDAKAAAKPAKSGGKGGSRQPLIVNPPTEEYRRWRKIWWTLLLGSLFLTIVSLAIRQWTDYLEAATVLLAVGYAAIFAALYIDWAIIRRLRKEWVASGGSAGEGKDAEKAGGKSSKSAGDGPDAGEKGSE